TFNTNALGILLGASLEGEVITATATDLNGNTSEFSAAIVATEDFQGAGLAIGRGAGRQAVMSGMTSGASPMVVDQAFADSGVRGSMASGWLGAHTAFASAPHASQGSTVLHPRLDDLARLMALDLAEILDA